LPDIKEQAKAGIASSLMLRMHSFAVARIEKELPSHCCGYIWNDSIFISRRNWVT
jgi:hypothetical protein